MLAFPPQEHYNNSCKILKYQHHFIPHLASQWKITPASIQKYAACSYNVSFLFSIFGPERVRRRNYASDETAGHLSNL